MIAMYLLGNPDHYMSHHFAPFYWNTFVKEVEKVWSLNDMDGTEKVMLIRKKGWLLGLSNTYDYTFHSEELLDLCVYDWASSCKHEKVKAERLEKVLGDLSTFSDHDGDDDHSNSVANLKDSFQFSGKKVKSKQKTNLYPFLAAHPLSLSHTT